MSEQQSEKALTPSGPSALTHRRRSGPLFLFLLLLVGGVVTAGWYGWQLLREVQLRDEARSESTEQMRKQLQEHEQTDQQQRSQLRQRLDQLEAEVASQKDVIQQVRAGGQTAWLLNEAEALASLAQQRLLLTGDAEAARRLLQAADKVLSRVDSAGVIGARKALAADLEKLRGAGKVDINGLVMRLAALHEQVAQLAVPAGRRVAAEQPAADRRAADQPGGDGWSALLARLPVTVRRQDEALPLPLDRQQASLLRLYLDTELQQAQLALLQSRPEVYEAALESARSTLSAWFSEGAVTQLDQSLAELQQVSLQQALPDIGDGLAAIRALIREREGGE